MLKILVDLNVRKAKPMWKTKSITVKFVSISSLLTLFLVTVLSMTLISTANTSQSKQAEAFSASLKDEQVRQAELLRQNVLKKGDTLVALLSQTAAGLIAGYDFDSLQHLATAVTQDNDIKFVTFYDTEKEALTDIAEDRDGVEILTQEILFDEDGIGSVEIGLDLKSVDQTITAITKRIDQVVSDTHASMAASQSRSIWQTAIYATVGVLVLCLAIFYTLRQLVTKPIHRIIEDLSNSSSTVASASGQISSSSHLLAEGSSEQAASIEETSASLEEMSSMTKQNADNSRQADALMQEANAVITTANQTMDDMTVSMAEITKTSQETQKIVKTIDEIAFQTNLLALNAAVEAARAGEAGAGFAVVADEVRNLAMRAADAARNTSGLIEGSVHEIEQGSGLLDATYKAFDNVSVSAEKVTQLIGEIAAASDEQAQGIEQVNTAVGEMDKVVQHNAATAEESASAAQEMSTQAEHLKTAVDSLVALVEGQRGTHKAKTTSDISMKTGRNTPEKQPPADVRITPETIVPAGINDTFDDF